ncbi:MAG: hypothetical protein CVT74_08755 [Alphaproteobacteria bacterium HGW-Alphaproteobacteria-13]|nr:MAG: hypothetical protein CVT74_08755 [Alphaproteobacteria bacterium HGW-Alphaproteobacteria-13]
MKDFVMDDQLKPFGSDWSRRYYDSSHPLYIASAAEDGLARMSHGGGKTELGPWGRRALYAAFALVASYFALILAVGSH